MFTATRKAARKCHRDGGATEIPTECFPERYSFSQLYNELAGGETISKSESLENILLLASCLEQPSRLAREDGDQDAIIKISSWVSKTILPDGSTVSKDDIPSDSQAASLGQVVKIAQRLGLHGLKCLQSLLNLHSLPSNISAHQVLLSVIAFTSSCDPWTTASSKSLADSILEENLHETRELELVIDFLLQSIIRPLFSKSKPSTITSTGRKAMPSSAPLRNYNVSDSLDPAQKPWKYASPFAVTVFEWAIENSSEETVTQSWNLFVPPLVTLLDDPSTPIRSRGLSITSSFLPKMGGKRLMFTGLAEVFEDAVIPTLMFLPSITPVDESMQLLGPAYNALFILADVRWGPATTEKTGRESENEQKQIKFYDRVMRKGILSGYMHAHEYLEIVELLTSEIEVLVKKMGIHAVKHLKDILPILSYGMTDPFASSSKLQLATINTLKSVILTCWPRISQPVHYRSILKSMVLCWNNIEGNKADQGNVRNGLKDLAQLLVTCAESPGPADTDSGIKNDILAVVEADPHLEELFSVKITRQDGT